MTLITRATGPTKATARTGQVRVGKQSKTNDPACSEAMSKWKSSGTLTHEIAIILAKCRNKARQLSGRQQLSATDVAKRLESKVESIRGKGSVIRKPLPSKASQVREPAKTLGELVSANRIGKGKEAKIILHNGEIAPEHIKPSMIPPSWKNVHVSTHKDSDVLAVAMDERGNPKKVYADNYLMRNEANKFSRIHDMMHEHEDIMREIHRDRQSRDPETREHAHLTWLIEQQGTRPGGEVADRSKLRSKETHYGATTLEGRHVVEVGGKVRLRFIGKEGVKHNHVITHPELAEHLLERKREVGDRGKLFNTDEKKLNEYIKGLGSGGYTAKDFRTRLGTSMAIEHIRRGPKRFRDAKSLKKHIREISTKVSEKLGNKPKQSFDDYISPHVWSGLTIPEGAQIKY